MDVKKIILMLVLSAAIISIAAVAVAAADIISSDISIENEIVSGGGLSRYSLGEDISSLQRTGGKTIPVALGTITLNVSSDSDAYLKKLENALNGDVNATLLLELKDNQTGKACTFTQKNLSSVIMQGDEVIVEIHAEPASVANGDISNPEIKFLRIGLDDDVNIVANPSS